jgi:hypothetical protein
MARGQHNGEGEGQDDGDAGGTMAHWRGRARAAQWRGGDEDKRLLSIEIWPSILELKGFDCPIENS